MKRVVGSPLTWALAAFAAALPWTLTGNGADLVPMLCLLVSGFFAGLVVMRLLARIPSDRAALWTHVGVAAGFALYGALVVPRYSAAMDWLEHWLPRPVVTLLMAVGMAAVTAAGVVWITLLGRLLAAIPSGRASSLPAPEWEGLSSGARADFSAVPMTRRAFLWIASGCTLLALAAAVVVFVLVEPVVSRWSPRLLLLAFGSCLLLPVYLAGRGYLRARTRACSVVCARGRIELSVGAARSMAHGASRGMARGVDSGPDHFAAQRAAPEGPRLVVPFRDLDALTWCAVGDAARIELRWGGQQRSLLVGIAKHLPGKRAALPELSKRVRAELRAAGLEELPSPRSPDMRRYARTGTEHAAPRTGR